MNAKTINLTGAETKIEFDRNYAFIEVNNLSGNEILVSTKPEIVRGNDDVIIISAKTIATIGEAGSLGIKEIYASGSGEIQLIGKNFAEHCFKLPASGDGSDETKDKHFQLIGSGGFFDVSSIDISNKIWKNLANGNDITLETNTVEIDGDRVHFCSNDYGIFETPHPKTIYCIFKSVPQSSDVIILGGWYNRAAACAEINIETYSDNIYLAANSNSVKSTISAVDICHIVCVTMDSNNYGVLYINDNMIGKTESPIVFSDNYTGKYFIHKLSRSSAGSLANIYKMTHCDYKFLAFDTEPHSEDMINENMAYLKKYL